VLVGGLKAPALLHPILQDFFRRFPRTRQQLTTSTTSWTWNVYGLNSSTFILVIWSLPKS